MKKITHVQFERMYEAMVAQFDSMVYKLTVMEQQDLQNLRKLVRRGKTEGPNVGQYGYYANYPHTVTQIHKLMTMYKLNSIIDLGSGPGHLLTALKILGYTVKGIEIEESLINLIPWSDFNNVKKGDILKPIRNIEDYQAVYFYEPFTDANMAEAFVQNLERIMVKDQYIFYTRAGRIYDFLCDSKYFRKLKQRGHIFVFKKL